MIVRLTSAVIVGGIHRNAGEEVKVDSALGDSLMRRCLAEPIHHATKPADASVHFQLAAEVSTKETTTASEEPALEAPASEDPVVEEPAPTSDASPDADDEGAELLDEASDEAASKSASPSRKRRRR